MECDALPVAFVRQFFQYVASEGGGIHDVVVRPLRVEHREAFMVAGCEADVSCPGSLDGGDPFTCIEA